MHITSAIKLYLLDLKVATVTPKHIVEVDRIIHRLAAWLESESVTEIEQVTAAHLKAYQVLLQEMTIASDDFRVSLRGKKVSPQTSLTYMRRVRAFFSWAERAGYLTGPNPVARIPKIKVPGFVIPAFTPEQMSGMLGTMDTSTPPGMMTHPEAMPIVRQKKIEADARRTLAGFVGFGVSLAVRSGLSLQTADETGEGFMTWAQGKVETYLSEAKAATFTELMQDRALRLGIPLRKD